MKILIFNWRDISNPKSGGAEYATFEHAKGWVFAGHKVTWLSSNFKNCKREEVISGVRFVRRGNSLTVFLYAFLFYVTHSDYDVVVDEIHGIPFFTPFYVKCRRLIFIHEIAKEIWDYTLVFPFNYFMRLIEPLFIWIYRNEKFMTGSNSTKIELVEHGIKPNQIQIVHHGVSLPVSNTVPKKNNQPTYVFINRLVRMKKVEDVIIAFSEIKKLQAQSVLYVVGDGDKDYVKEIKNLVLKLKLSDVVFTGKITEEEKKKLLQKSHILLHTSSREGWGLVVIEAASQGTPSVVYDSPGLRDSVIDGKTGVLVTRGNTSELCLKAVELYKNSKLFKNMQINCLKWAQKFNWKQSVLNSEELLKTL